MMHVINTSNMFMLELRIKITHKEHTEIPQKAEKSAGRPAQDACCQHSPGNEINIIRYVIIILMELDG